MSAISGVSSQMPVNPVQNPPATGSKSTQSGPTHQDQVNISESARRAAMDNTGAHTGVDVDHDGDHS